MHSFDTLPCPVLLTGRDGCVVSLNQNLLEVTGRTKDAVLNLPMEQLFPVASRIFLQTHIWPLLLRQNQVREIKLQILARDGKHVPVLVNCDRTPCEEGDCYTWVLFISTERSLFEQELLAARQRAETVSAELAKSEHFIRTVSDALPSMVGYWDTELQCQFANKPYQEWFGISPPKLIGMHISKLLGDKVFEQNWPHMQAALQGEAQEFERKIIKPDGSVGYLLINYIPNLSATGTVKGFFALLTNISRLREADAAIRLSASVFDATTEGIMVTDIQANIISVNPAFCRLTGYSADEIVGQNARILKSGQHESIFFGAMFEQLQSTRFWKGEVWTRRKDASLYLEGLSISAITDDSGTTTGYVGVCSDITDRWDKEQTVRHMALHDGLTGLPNRMLFMERLEHTSAMSTRDPRLVAVLFLDLDGFKGVNDTLGHSAGDTVLKVVATRLLALLRPADTVARLGGDEFVVLLDNPDCIDSVRLIAERIIEDVNLPIPVDGQEARVGTSIGIAIAQTNAMQPEVLLKRADDAMYAAKAAGKNVARLAE